jgi:large subunit ribosomal protein L29
MEPKELREMNDDQLQAEEATLRESVFRLKFKVSLGEVDALKNLRQARKELARVKTIERERQLGIKRGA